MPVTSCPRGSDHLVHSLAWLTLFCLTTMLNAAARCTSLTSISAGRRQSKQVAGARDTVSGSDAIGRAEAHSADGYRLVDALIRRPAPGHFEVAQLTHQARHQRAERAALGDRVPPATLGDSPPEAAPARGDLSWPAGSEPAPAVHAPHGEARCAGRQAFNRLIKTTHRKACGYPARTLPCLRFNSFWAYSNSASPEDHRPGFLVGARGRVTITTDGRGRRRTALPRSDMPQRRWPRGNARHVGQRVRTAATRSARAARPVAESCLLPGMRLQMNYTLSSRKRSLSFWRNHR